MKTLTSSVLLDGLVFPEGPRWHDGKLWFSDIHAHRVMAVDPEGRSEVIASVPQRPSGLGFLPDGRLLPNIPTDKIFKTMTDKELMMQAWHDETLEPHIHLMKLLLIVFILAIIITLIGI